MENTPGLDEEENRISDIRPENIQRQRETAPAIRAVKMGREAAD